eukprot:scaffold123110_cov31-Prasinocladus_malaysianus.AAC.1
MRTVGNIPVARADMALRNFVVLVLDFRRHGVLVLMYPPGCWPDVKKNRVRSITLLVRVRYRTILQCTLRGLRLDLVGRRKGFLRTPVLVALKIPPGLAQFSTIQQPY